MNDYDGVAWSQPGRSGLRAGDCRLSGGLTPCGPITGPVPRRLALQLFTLGGASIQFDSRCSGTAGRASAALTRAVSDFVHLIPAQLVRDFMAALAWPVQPRCEAPPSPFCCDEVTVR